MKIWLVVLLGGQLVATKGPVPGSLDACQEVARAERVVLLQKLADKPKFTKSWLPSDVVIECRIQPKRPE